MMKELIILAQVSTQTPNIMDDEQVPVYSWEKPYTAPRWQRPATGIFMPSGSGNVPSLEEEVEAE